MYTFLSIVQVFISIVLIFLVLLHSGKDAGLSGAFGIGGALIALWPSPLAARRRVSSLYAARLGRELSRA